MTVEEFNYLCEKLGDQTKDVKDRWKDIKYIHVHGSYEPMDDFQKMLARDEIIYVTTPTPGFIYMSTPMVEYTPITNSRTVSFIGLNVISEITFNCQDVYDEGKIVYGITDIYNHMTGENLPLPVKFSDCKINLESFGETDTYSIVFKTDRPITKDDYDVIYKSIPSNTELHGKPSKPGVYSVTFKCKGNYVGEITQRFVIPECGFATLSI